MYQRHGTLLLYDSQTILTFCAVSKPIFRGGGVKRGSCTFCATRYVGKFIYSRLSRSFTARGFTSGDPTKGIRLISSRVTKLSQRYNKNTCLTLVKHYFIYNCIGTVQEKMAGG